MSGVDRAALIEAAAEAIRQRWNLPESSIRPNLTGDAEVVLDAVLPLVAQAIEGLAERGEREQQSLIAHGFPVAASFSEAHGAGIKLGAALVRSLAEEGQQQ